MSTMSTIHSYQCKALTLQRYISNPTASSPTNNSYTSGLDDNDLCEADDLAELISGNEKRKMGIMEWRRHQRIPKGALKMVSPGSMYALSSSSSTTPLKYTMQLDPIHQHHLPPPLFVTKHPHKIPKLNLTPIKNQETAHGIPCSSWSQRTQIQTTKHRKQ